MEKRSLSKGQRKRPVSWGKLDKDSLIKARWDRLSGVEFSGPPEKEKNKSH